MTTEQVFPPHGGPATIEGAVSLEINDAGVKPWRLPFPLLDLFEPPVVAVSEQPSGVRLTLLSDTPRLTLEVEPPTGPDLEWAWDILVDGRLHERVKQSARQSRVVFDSLPHQKGKPQRIEVYLPLAYFPVRLRSVAIPAGAVAQRWQDTRKRWVAYGSSITQAADSAGPSETWPAIVANRFGLHLTSVGYGGQEHLEPMIARMIRDLPADYISICVGGNVCGSSSLSDRTYRAAVIGLVKTIRDKHATTPIVVTSFISGLDDGSKNKLGFVQEDYRRWTQAGVEALQRGGDANLKFFPGPTIFGPEFKAHQPDGVHPDAEGNRILGRRYGDLVMPLFGLAAKG